MLDTTIHDLHEASEALVGFGVLWLVSGRGLPQANEGHILPTYDLGAPDGCTIAEIRMRYDSRYYEKCLTR